MTANDATPVVYACTRCGARYWVAETHRAYRSRTTRVERHDLAFGHQAAVCFSDFCTLSTREVGTPEWQSNTFRRVRLGPAAATALVLGRVDLKGARIKQLSHWKVR